MSKYIKYFIYIVEHKYNIYRAYKLLINSKKILLHITQKELFKHVITHDLSKFSYKEFGPYARYFYGDYPSISEVGCKIDLYSGKTKEDVKYDFDKAWEHHYKFNPHHPEFWEGYDMPYQFIIFMLLDLTAMSLKFGDTPHLYYLKHYDEFKMTDKTRRFFHWLLFVNPHRPENLWEANYDIDTIERLIHIYNDITLDDIFKGIILY